MAVSSMSLHGRRTALLINSGSVISFMNRVIPVHRPDGKQWPRNGRSRHQSQISARFRESQTILARGPAIWWRTPRSEEHTSELLSRENLVCRLLLEKKKQNKKSGRHVYTTDKVC